MENVRVCIHGAWTILSNFSVVRLCSQLFDMNVPESLKWAPVVQAKINVIM